MLNIILSDNNVDAILKSSEWRFLKSKAAEAESFQLHKQEAFEKCWAHLPQRAAARCITIHQVSLLSRRMPPAHWCPRRRRQRQRVTEGTAMAPWNGPNDSESEVLNFDECTWFDRSLYNNWLQWTIHRTSLRFASSACLAFSMSSSRFSFIVFCSRSNLS